MQDKVLSEGYHDLYLRYLQLDYMVSKLTTLTTLNTSQMGILRLILVIFAILICRRQEHEDC